MPGQRRRGMCIQIVVCVCVSGCVWTLWIDTQKELYWDAVCLGGKWSIRIPGLIRQKRPWLWSWWIVLIFAIPEEEAQEMSFGEKRREKAGFPLTEWELRKKRKKFFILKWKMSFAPIAWIVKHKKGWNWSFLKLESNLFWLFAKTIFSFFLSFLVTI